MIKRIQLRGISRDPSDRMNSDGGCAESLNVQLNNDELEPTPVPVVANTALGIPATLKVLYIHKVGEKDNYIGLVGTSVTAKIEDKTDMVPIYALASGESLVGITSVGKILVWTTKNGTRYAIFRDGTYTCLGDSVPEPTVTFSTTAGTQKVAEFDTTHPSISLIPLVANAYEYWNIIYSMVGLSNSEKEIKANEFYNDFKERLWENVNAARVQLRGNNEFSAPVLARYALRMYDGSYMYISAPVVLMGGVDHGFIEVRSNWAQDADTPFRTKVYFRNTYTASVRVDFGDTDDWGDLIESVDIFISTDILIPKIDSKPGQAFDSGSKNVDPSYDVSGNDAGFEFNGVSDYAWIGGSTKNRFKDDFETQMLEKANFYKVASIPVSSQEYWVEQLKPKAQDDLVVMPRLSEGEAHQITGLGGVGSYNERLILTGERITISKANQRPDAMKPIGTYTGHTYVTAYFYVRTSTGGTKIVESYSDLDIIDHERARAYITYPDPKCYRAVYYVPKSGGYYKYTIPMKEHPRLNTAYGFWGLGLRLDELVTGDTRSVETVTTIAEVEDRTYDVDNRLFLSEVDNPFVFPLGQRSTLPSKIIAARPITIPMSSYQFGQSDLYIFTEDGIYTVAVTDEGKLAQSTPPSVSRDVAIPGTICLLDQSLIFATKKGVMLLTVNGAQNISPNLESKRDVLGKYGTLSSLGDWNALMAIALDTTSFLEFIQGATFAYDYPGKRILAFNAGENYAWVYKLDTATWHRQQNPSGVTPVVPINSYPEALMTFAVTGTANFSVIDFTTDKTATPSLRTALVITRSIDLDMPDVRKQIKALRVKGYLGDGGSAQVILMGSMDGIYYDRLTTMRSGSYKFYKLAMLLKLKPDERVSWVDIDFEPRFQNKLR